MPELVGTGKLSPHNVVDGRETTIPASLVAEVVRRLLWLGILPLLAVFDSAPLDRVIE
jgi:hypothetical protein